MVELEIFSSIATTRIFVIQGNAINTEEHLFQGEF